jgi:F-type H+-transporting ATPase subunit b
MHIDWWTLALQTVNVLVLVWLLARFLFRPVRTIIAERHAAAEKLLSDAAAVRARAETDAAEIQRRLQGVSAEAERILTEARAHAEAERAKLLQQAAETVSHTHDEAKAAIENDRLTMERALRQRTGDLAIAIARRLLQRLPARTATVALLEALTAAVTELPGEERRNLAAAGGPLDIVTAVPLDERQQTECRNMMGRVLGRAPTLVFRTDPKLIAGVELHTAQMLIRNSWQADLEHIAGELRQDEQHDAGSEHLV